MSSFDDLTRAVTCKFNNKVKKSCEHLFQYVGLNNFWYYKVGSDGGYTYVGSNAPFSEYYSSRKLYMNFPLYRHPRFFRTEIKLFRAIPDLPYEFTKAADKHDFHNEILFMKKTADSVEGFGFASISNSAEYLAKMINALPLLRLFMSKFKEENMFLFSKLEDHQIDLAGLVGQHFFDGEVVQPADDSNKRLLMRKLGLDLGATFSQRELDVLKLVHKGYPAAKIAEELFLSRRTVEHHIERVKERLGCNLKTELIQKTKAWESLSDECC